MLYWNFMQIYIVIIWWGIERPNWESIRYSNIAPTSLLKLHDESRTGVNSSKYSSKLHSMTLKFYGTTKSLSLL